MGCANSCPAIISCCLYALCIFDLPWIRCAAHDISMDPLWNCPSEERSCLTRFRSYFQLSLKHCDHHWQQDGLDWFSWVQSMHGHGWFSSNLRSGPKICQSPTYCLVHHGPNVFLSTFTSDGSFLGIGDGTQTQGRNNTVNLLLLPPQNQSSCQALPRADSTSK